MDITETQEKVLVLGLPRTGTTVVSMGLAKARGLGYFPCKSQERAPYVFDEPFCPAPRVQQMQAFNTELYRWVVYQHETIDNFLKYLTDSGVVQIKHLIGEHHFSNGFPWLDKKETSFSIACKLIDWADKIVIMRRNINDTFKSWYYAEESESFVSGKYRIARPIDYRLAERTAWALQVRRSILSEILATRMHGRTNWAEVMYGDYELMRRRIAFSLKLPMLEEAPTKVQRQKEWNEVEVPDYYNLTSVN